MHRFIGRVGVLVCGMLLATSAVAATTVTGQIQSSLVLTSSCLVNGASGASNLNFGTMNFGTATSLFTQVGIQLQASGGGAIAIQCSAGVTPTVTIKGGLHDGQSAGGTRALADGAGNFVPYDLYTDAGLNNLLSNTGVINMATSTGVAQTFNLWGKVVGKAGLPAGTYTDTISVTLSF